MAQLADRDEGDGVGAQRRPKILLVDDDPKIRSFVRPALEAADFDCIEAEDPLSALYLVDTEAPDLIILDILLGDDRLDGLDVCQKIRSRGIGTPVVFLSVLDRTRWPNYIVEGFKRGGNDYVEKREELKRLQETGALLDKKGDVIELIARIKARLPQPDRVAEFDGYLRVDPESGRAFVNRGGSWRDAGLTPTEFSILERLVQGNGRPVTKSRLLEATGMGGDDHAVETHISRLRRKIEPAVEAPKYVLTYHRVGYSFRRPPSA